MNIDIRQGDVLDVLRTMPSESVHCVITSPPYFGLRDYGTALWDGGDAECQHKPAPTQGQTGQRSDRTFTAVPPYKQVCGKCGATRIDKQIGLEDTPDAYLQRMVEVFREVRRVLRSDGTCWVNMGDSYAGGGGYYPDSPSNQPDVAKQRGAPGAQLNGSRIKSGGRDRNTGAKPKDLLMMPARLALALQADGWWLRSDIIWCKRAPMPESVTDRPTSAHEHIFLLTKAARYFYDADAVREAVSPASIADGRTERGQRGTKGEYSAIDGNCGYNPAGRNLWNYWLLSPEPYPDAHFATFPTEIPRRCIKAGTSEHGVCGECGAPYRRVVERTANGGWTAKYQQEQAANGMYPNGAAAPVVRGKRVSGADNPAQVIGETWQPTCAHTSAPVVPATVLDIFNGSGTTGLVALELGRHYIGIELNPQYVELTRKRLMSEMPLFAYQALEGAA